MEMIRKIEELRNRTINILEKTKRETTKYAKERKQVDKYFIESTKKDNLIEWENFLNYFEEIIEEKSENGNGAFRELVDEVILNNEKFC